MKNRNKFFEIIFAAAAVLFAGCSNSINPQEKSLPGTVIIKPVLPGQGARYVSPELDTPNMIYYYYAKKAPSQTADNNSYSDNYFGFLENKSFSAALKNRGYNVGDTVKVADGEYLFNVLGYTVSTPESITNVISDIKKLKNSNDQTQGQNLPSQFTVSGSVKVDCKNKTTVQVPMFWNGDYTGLGINTTTPTATSNYPNVKVVDALDFSCQFQSGETSYANGNNGTASAPTYDFCLKLTECIAQPNTEPIIVELKNTDVNGVFNLIVETNQIEPGVITTTVKINPACTEVITAGLWNIGFYKGREIVSAYQYNTVMLVPGVKTTFNLDFNSNSPASSVFVKITGQSSGTAVGGSGTLLSPFTEFKYSLDDYHNTEVLLSNVEHNTEGIFNRGAQNRIVLDLNGFKLSAGKVSDTDSSYYPFTACNSTIKNGIVNAHLEMTNGGSLENVTFPVESEASGIILDANIISVEGSNAEDVSSSIVYSFKNVTADYIQIKNPGVIIDSLVNGTNNIKGIIIGEKGLNNLPTITNSWRIGNPNTDFNNISLFKYVEDNQDLKTFKIVDAADYKIENGCIVYRPEPMGVISKDDGTMFNFCSLQGGNSIATPGTESSYQINGVDASICAKTFDHNGYPWVLASSNDNIDGILYYYILNQDSSVFCKIDNSDLVLTDVVMAADDNYLYLCCGSNTLLRIPYSDLLNKEIIIQNDAIHDFDLTGGEEVIVSNFSLAAADNGDLYLLYKYDYYTLDENNNRLKVSLEKITKIYFDESGKLVVDTQSTKVLTGSDEGVLSRFFPVIEFSKKDFYYTYKNIWGEPDQNGTWPDHTGYQFHSDDSSLSAYGPSEKISINYSCYDMVYNNGKLYIPVDIKLDGVMEGFPVVVSTGNLIVYDIYSDNFEVKGNTIDSNKLENLEIPKAVVNYDNIFNDVDMEKPAETFKIVTYLPEPDQTQALMGAGKIIAIKDDQVIFVENGVFFEMDSYGKWKTSNNQGEKIKYKHKQQAVIFTNNLFQRASVPTDYINYSNSGSTTIPVGYTLDCNIDGHSSELHTLQYQFDVE